ncbi:MAG: glutamine synthetase beta-grasp domain-containing protein [Candidatus Micrarchaeota archaeon]
MVTAQEVLKDIQESELRWVNLQFIDLEGRLRNMSIPSNTLNTNTFSRGIPKLDPTGIRSFRGAGDEMVLLPDPETYTRLPWDTLSCRMFCNLQEAMGGPRSEFDSRHVTSKTENALSGAGYSLRIGIKLEFFVFDSITADIQTPYKHQGYTLDSREGAWNYYGQNYPIDFGAGYMASPPMDALSVFRSNVSDMLEGAFAIRIDSHKHSYASTGHCSIEMRYSSLMKTADNVVTSKYVVRNVGLASGLMPTFMPKPINIQKGGSMCVHQSLWMNDKNIFFDPSEEKGELSQSGRYYVGGILSHAPALCALTNATTNSYKRLTAERMTHATWGFGDRSTSVRIPAYNKNNEDSKRIEYRLPDPGCNPHLSLSSIVLAGLDGIKNKIDPGSTNKSTPAASGKALPRTLSDAIEALKSDSSFLRAAFPSTLVDQYCDAKNEDILRELTTPTPMEFKHYLDI